MNREVLVVIGVGGTGHVIARRQGTGKLVLLAAALTDAFNGTDGSRG
ncbi:hypothetical protein ACFYO5_23945 [Streptomyces sp. NPDC006259]